jgi:hypothetical protein
MKSSPLQLSYVLSYSVSGNSCGGMLNEFYDPLLRHDLEFENATFSALNKGHEVLCIAL